MDLGSCKKSFLNKYGISEKNLLQDEQIFRAAFEIKRQPIIYHPRTSPSKPYRFIASNTAHKKMP
jgi:hypothetical protein